MRPICILAAVPVLMAAVTAAFPDDVKQSKAKKAATTEQDYQALGNTQIVGKIVRIQPSDKTLTLEVAYSLLKPKNKNSLKHASPAVAQLYRAQQQMLNQQKFAGRSPTRAAKHLHQLQQHSGRVGRIGGGKAPAHFTIITERKEFDLQAIENALVRIGKLPTQFDDKGQRKPYTDQELKERKGPNPNLPGYTSSFAELKAGQTVKIKLGRAKPTKPKEEPDSDDHPRITLIVILDDPDAADGAKKAK